MSEPLRHPEKAHRPDSAPQPKRPDWIKVKVGVPCHCDGCLAQTCIQTVAAVRWGVLPS